MLQSSETLTNLPATGSGCVPGTVTGQKLTQGDVRQSPAGHANPAPLPSGQVPVASDASPDPAVCDRVLLYIRSTGMEPVAGLELALAALRRAGPHADIATAMGALRVLMREQGAADLPAQARLCSVPPMDRCTMLPEPLDRTPIRTAIKNSLRGLCRFPGRRTARPTP